MNDKEFVLTVTGLLKLKLIDRISLTRDELYRLVEGNIDGNGNVGLLISLWRNFIRY